LGSWGEKRALRGMQLGDGRSGGAVDSERVPKVKKKIVGSVNK